MASRTSALSEHEIAGIQIVPEGGTGLNGAKAAIQQTIVSRRREEVCDDRREQEDQAHNETGSAGDNFHPLSDGEESASETEVESLDKQEPGVRDR